MRMIFTKHLAHDTGGFFIGRIGADAHIVHGKQDAAVDGFQAVAGVGQGAGHNYAHGVIEIGVAHLGVDVNLLNVADVHNFLTWCCASKYAIRN